MPLPIFPTANFILWKMGVPIVEAPDVIPRKEKDLAHCRIVAVGGFGSVNIVANHSLAVVPPLVGYIGSITIVKTNRTYHVLNQLLDCLRTLRTKLMGLKLFGSNSWNTIPNTRKSRSSGGTPYQFYWKWKESFLSQKTKKSGR